MCLTLLQPRVKQSGAPVFKQPIVPPGLVIHFYHCLYHLRQDTSLWTGPVRSVWNSAARLICRIRQSELINPALIGLQWLRVPERISFRLALMTYRSIQGTSPSYLQSCFTRVADMTSRRRLRSSNSVRLCTGQADLSGYGAPSGTTCLSTSCVRRHSRFLDNDSRHSV